jgi:hypothetical protein
MLFIVNKYKYKVDLEICVQDDVEARELLSCFSRTWAFSRQLCLMAWLACSADSIPRFCIHRIKGEVLCRR